MSAPVGIPTTPENPQNAADVVGDVGCPCGGDHPSEVTDCCAVARWDCETTTSYDANGDADVTVCLVGYGCTTCRYCGGPNH